MPKTRTQEVARLHGLVGRTIDRVHVEAHAFKGVVDPGPPIRLYLRLSETEYVCIGCGADGESLYWDESLPEPVDMEESGEIVIADRTNQPPWFQVNSRTVESVAVMRSPEGGAIEGIKLEFGDGRRVLVVNNGDEFWIDDEYPPGTSQNDWAVELC